MVAQAAMGMSMPPWQQDFTSDSEAGHYKDPACVLKMFS